MKKPISMLIAANVVFIGLAVLFRVLFGVYEAGWMQSAYITFLTVSYHFLMRIMVGEIITLCYQKREFHYASPWYRQKNWEKKLCKAIRIQKWKQKLITAKPEQFDIRARSYDELLHNMTQAEIVHEIVMVLSFLPLLLIIPYGQPFVFLLTSCAASMIDGIFVLLQRYNRPRLLRIKARGRILH